MADACSSGDGCNSIPVFISPEKILTVYTWNNWAENSVVQLYSYHDLGHRWHGDATDIIWGFFSLHQVLSE